MNAPVFKKSRLLVNGEVPSFPPVHLSFLVLRSSCLALCAWFVILPTFPCHHIVVQIAKACYPPGCLLARNECHTAGTIRLANATPKTSRNVMCRPATRATPTTPAHIMAPIRGGTSRAMGVRNQKLATPADRQHVQANTYRIGNAGMHAMTHKDPPGVEMAGRRNHVINRNTSPDRPIP